jgi:broad specificity phosphatase PhoE
LTAFYLVRHAHARWTLDENRSLSVQGLKDAKQVADVLQNYPITEIYSSPEQRAFQTISPFAEQLDIQIEIEAALCERKLGDEVFEDFFGAVEATWQNQSFAHPGGESSVEGQNRGLNVVKQLQSKHPNEAVVLSTHGNLMALILQAFDPSIGFSFWKSLTMPDIYQLTIKQAGSGSIKRLWTSAAK